MQPYHRSLRLSGFVGESGVELHDILNGDRAHILVEAVEGQGQSHKHYAPDDGPRLIKLPSNYFDYNERV